MENITFTQAAKSIFTDNADAIKSALDLAVNSKERVNSAAQIVALTSYKAFEANGEVIPAANIAAFLNLTSDETKKMKQYVSRAAYVWGYKGKTYNIEHLELNTPHDDFMTGDNPPSITSTYKDIKAHEKAQKEAIEAQRQAQAMELKAAQAYADSGEPMPEGVNNATELLTKARASRELGLENAFTAALGQGESIVAEQNAEIVAHDKAQELLTQGQGVIDALNELGDYGIDAINLLAGYMNDLNRAHNAEIEAEQQAA